MANIANVVAYDGTATQKTFTALQGSSGDKTPARWAISAAVPNVCLTVAQMSCEWNRARTARHVNFDLVVPYVVTNTNTGVISPVSRAEYHGRFILPSNVPQSIQNDLVWFAATFMGSNSASVDNAAVRSQIATGYAYS